MFLLGYLIFGMLLMNFMHENSGMAKDVLDKFHKTMAEFNWGAMVISHIAAGFLFATIALWANARSLGAGLKTGAIVGILFSLHIDGLFFATSNIYTVTSLCVQIVAVTVLITISTGVIGMVLGTGKTTEN